MAGQYDELVFTAMPGEANRVTAQRLGELGSSASVWTVRDEGAPLVAGPGCTSVDTHTARCDSSPTRFELGDDADQLRVIDAVRGLVESIAEGGAGNDVLVVDGAAAKPHPDPSNSSFGAGRRLASRPSGVLALTTLRLEGARGFALATARWAIRLK